VAVAFFDPRREEAVVGAEIDAAVGRVRSSGTLVLGPEVEAFESAFAALCGVGHCVGVGNGTDALQLLLRADGVGPGHEVLVPAYTAVATWMAVSLVGATPVGVDVEAGTFCLDPGSLTDRARAVIGVDLFGHPADWDAIAQFASRHGLLVYEDAAQAHGAFWRGRRAGSLARGAAFSFYPTKNLGALGDAGAVTTDDPALADHLRLLRMYGWRRRDASEIKGLNSRLDELQAAVLRVKLARLDAWNERRREIASRYLAALADTGLRLPTSVSGAEHVWHQFVVTHGDRDVLRARLAEAGIQTLVHYDPLPHLTAAYRADGWSEGDLPVAERLSSEALSLPMSPHLTEGEVDEVIEAVRAAVR
jgi:dTDP-3-amino-3,4,6-trideoxy-alpha-D-glucose transaminase